MPSPNGAASHYGIRSVPKWEVEEECIGSVRICHPFPRSVIPKPGAVQPGERTPRGHSHGVGRSFAPPEKRLRSDVMKTKKACLQG